MLIETLFFIFSTIFLIVASIFDLRTREIPDTLSYIFIIGALLMSLIYSFFTTINFFLYSILSALIVFGAGYLFYRLKQIGGGDVKLFTGVAALLGNFTLFGFSAVLVFFFLLLFIGGVYTLVWSAVLFFQERSKGWKKLMEVLHGRKRIRIILLLVSIILLVFALLFSSIGLLLGILVILLYVTFYLACFLRVVETLHFLKEIPLKELTEGDWLAKDVVLHGKILCSKRKACVEEKDIVILKKAKVEKVWIKVGIPFVPAIALTTIIVFIFLL
ncbi:prepilin peptidase [Candidatus Woesearchaeota archaeon]|nr:prepilin peptidase [Candidatus Woesearchaeota archaeon]